MCIICDSLILNELTLLIKNPLNNILKMLWSTMKDMPKVLCPLWGVLYTIYPEKIKF